MTKRNTLSKAEKARREAAADKLFNRPIEKKESENRTLTNRELKIFDSGLTAEEYEAFQNEHGFEYLQTFNQWKENGYRIKAGSKATKIELHSWTSGGYHKLKAYYYFTFNQVEKREEAAKPEAKPEPLTFDEIKAAYTLDSIPDEVFNSLTVSQQMEFLPF